MFANREKKWVLLWGCCLALLTGCGIASENKGAASVEGIPIAGQQSAASAAVSTASPTSSDSPERLSAPDAAEMPTSSDSPEQLSAPDAAEMPTSSASSEQFSAPDAAEQPTSSASPEQLSAPDAAEMPTSSDSAEQLSSPDAAEMPTSSASPEQLSSPAPIEPPSPSAPTEIPAVPSVEASAPALPPLQADTPQTGGHIIAIDAGHQAKGNKEKEPLGPGSEEMKAKVSSGTRGVATGIYEYELNLTIAQALKAELEARGYTIVMIRDTHEVDISNKERAETANTSGAEIFLRIHANGSENSSVHGTLTICNTAVSPYNPGIHDESLRLAQEVLSHMVALMGSKDRGVWETDTMSGINWCAIPVTIIEMGYMSNEDEDRLMQEPDYQSRIVQGIADGVDAYFQ